MQHKNDSESCVEGAWTKHTPRTRQGIENNSTTDYAYRYRTATSMVLGYDVFARTGDGVVVLVVSDSRLVQSEDRRLGSP